MIYNYTKLTNTTIENGHERRQAPLIVLRVNSEPQQELNQLHLHNPQIKQGFWFESRRPQFQRAYCAYQIGCQGYFGIETHLKRLI